MTNHHGDFIWYELITPDPEGARSFYEAVVGWKIEAAPSGANGYRMIEASEGQVAGLMPLDDAMRDAGGKPIWLGYVAVDDVDAMVGSIVDAGGRSYMGPSDVDGVGRLALVADPYGASFYVLKPTPPVDRPDAESNAFSYDRPRLGHCAWNELATSDPEAALHFYGQRFGWVKDGEMPMGPAGNYHFIRHAARGSGGGPAMLGAVMDKPATMPGSAWVYYFRVSGIEAAAAKITAHDGALVQGPDQIPGGEYSLLARDPQGAMFGLVGKGKE